MICPNCGEESEFIAFSTSSLEPHGEQHLDECLSCLKCRERTDEAELGQANPEAGPAIAPRG